MPCTHKALGFSSSTPIMAIKISSTPPRQPCGSCAFFWLWLLLLLRPCLRAQKPTEPAVLWKLLRHHPPELPLGGYTPLPTTEGPPLRVALKALASTFVRGKRSCSTCWEGKELHCAPYQGKSTLVPTSVLPSWWVSRKCTAPQCWRLFLCWPLSLYSALSYESTE